MTRKDNVLLWPPFTGLGWLDVGVGERDWDVDYARVFGAVTDLHFLTLADEAILPSRYWNLYQQDEYRIYYTAEKRFAAALAKFKKISVSFAIQLGDYINAPPPAGSSGAEKLQRAESVRVASDYDGLFYHVIGNHEWGKFTGDWQNYADNITNSATINNYTEDGIVKAYCFERQGIRNIVLFAYLTETVSDAQMSWLENTALNSPLPKVVFSHSHLAEYDMIGLADVYAKIANRAEIRAILEADGNVQAVFHGHYHNNNVYELRNGIHYYGLRGSLLGTSLTDADSNAYYVVYLIPNSTWNGTRYIANVKLDGFVSAVNSTWTGETAASSSWSSKTLNAASWTPEGSLVVSWTPRAAGAASWTPETGNSSSWSPEDIETVVWTPETPASDGWAPETKPETNWS